MICIKNIYKICILFVLLLSIVFNFVQYNSILSCKIDIQDITEKYDYATLEIQDKNETIQEYESQIKGLTEEISSLKEEIASINSRKNSIQQNSRNNVIRNTDGSWTGLFKVYGYDACVFCCGKTDGITATGTKASSGRTIAVDPSVIPLGSQVIINGNTYIAEDTGSGIKGQKIDMFFNTHQEALQWGIRTLEVTVIPAGV